MSSPEVQRGIVYSVQDERLDPLKRKSSSVYIFESDNDFFLGVLFKHINNSVTPFRFFLFCVLCCVKVKCRCVRLCVCVHRLNMKGRSSLLMEHLV